jgi:hypothetical protein
VEKIWEKHRILAIYFLLETKSKKSPLSNQNWILYFYFPFFTNQYETRKRSEIKISPTYFFFLFEIEPLGHDDSRERGDGGHCEIYGLEKKSIHAEVLISLPLET